MAGYHPAQGRPPVKKAERGYCLLSLGQRQDSVVLRPSFPSEQSISLFPSSSTTPQSMNLHKRGGLCLVLDPQKQKKSAESRII